MGKKRKHSMKANGVVESVDDMMKACADDDSFSDDSSDEKEPAKKVKQVTKEEIPPTKKGRKQAAKKHADSLSNLQSQDPEFYEFLQKEDNEGLLNFDPDTLAYSSDGSDSDDEESHKPAGKLEVATDSEASESDDDETMETDEVVTKASKKKAQKDRINVTMAMIKQWSTSLRDQDSLQAFHQCVGAFRAAVLETSGDETDQSHLKYKVEGSMVFNNIVRVCILDMVPMLTRVLKLSTKSKESSNKKQALPATSAKWSKVKVDMKSYLTDLLQFMAHLSEPAILNVVLKHINQLVYYYACYPKLTKAMLKRLISIWSTGDETSRVLAFLSIIKLTRQVQDSFLEVVIKQMYMSFVQNSKFVSPNTLPLINFMQRSLVEIFALDLSLTYQYAFIYIRQMAIHLRNAITVKKKETVQAVYNWQYVNSLNLWARLLSQLYPNETLEPLIYPLTQVTIGTIKLVPSARYYPLRFHCVRTLNMLSEATNTFIPTLPFLIELFQQTDFNKNHKSASFKPFNFACILKLTPAQLLEKSFRDGIIDQTYDLLLESFAIHAHSVSFPELALPAVIQIKDFLKKCKVINFTKIMKLMLEKVQATSDYITKHRKSAGLTLKDIQRVEVFERRLKTEGTPLSKLYAQYKKKRTAEVQQEIAGKDRISSENLPKIERRPILGKASAAERKEFKGLFESDSEADGSSDSEDDENRFLMKEERPKKKRKTAEEGSDDSDQYSDFDDDEMEALDRSASEEDDENDEEDDDDSDEDLDDDSESEEESETKNQKKKLKSQSGNKKDKSESKKGKKSETESNKKGKSPKTKKSKKQEESLDEVDSDFSDHGDIVKDFEFSDSDSDEGSE